MVRCPTLLITPSTSTALVLAAFSTSADSCFFVSSRFASCCLTGADCSATVGADAGFGCSRTDVQATAQVANKKAAMVPIKVFTEPFILCLLLSRKNGFDVGRLGKELSPRIAKT